MDAKKIFGWNLRKARVERGISQQALALEVGIDPAYCGRIERGLENLSINIMEAMANCLDVPMAELFRIPIIGETMPIPLKAGRKKN
ncbi:helix-turn-helix transcriptional regulator [Rhizobium sp. TH2]|uniref:helix-turn-helix domain-containing protein n=1 Tax=Rhizobium sp. TH2 TaxID=2775403 RepID=UPI0021584C20|nr:helix-turn-helix transcriptional regulator [Rhizobium sp. TH2]UVC07225.1 helix-turn-helix transcriptional regulator [Rhizobium sp. TH2]